MSKLDAFKSKPSGKAADGNVVDFPAPKKRGKADGFAQISLRGAAEVSRKTKNAGFATLVMLAYKAFRAQSQTFIMSSDLSTVHGIHREARRRALIRFEKAGVIRIERRKGKAPIVTLLVKLD
jgi:hypothetical protein